MEGKGRENRINENANRFILFFEQLKYSLALLRGPEGVFEQKKKSNPHQPLPHLQFSL